MWHSKAHISNLIKESLKKELATPPTQKSFKLNKKYLYLKSGKRIFFEFYRIMNSPKYIDLVDFDICIADCLVCQGVY